MLYKGTSHNMSKYCDMSPIICIMHSTHGYKVHDLHKTQQTWGTRYGYGYKYRFGYDNQCARLISWLQGTTPKSEVQVKNMNTIYNGDMGMGTASCEMQL